MLYVESPFRAKIFSELKRLLREGDKFLILVYREGLKALEIDKGIYLGSNNYPNKIRPAIVLVSEEKGSIHYKLFFLTGSYLSDIVFDLRFCSKKSKLCKNFTFYTKSFLFSDRRIGYFCIKLKSLDQLRKFKYCGKCEDIEILEKISIREL